MLNCKINFWVGIAALIIICSSCIEHKVLFSFNDNVKPEFFKNIPGIGSDNFLNDTVVTKATSILVYKSSFSEKYIEKDHLLDISELNDSTKIPYADYWEVNGYAQDMYLLKYDFKVAPKKKPASKPPTINAMLFVSVKFNRNGDCIGFGPSYFGIIDYGFGYIDFPTELITKFYKNEFFLKPVKRFKITGGYLFFTSGLLTGDEHGNLNIQKIVELDTNKIGTYKPLVFNIPKIFRDSNAMQFHYDTTLNLPQ